MTRLCGAPEELLTNRDDVVKKYRQLVNKRRVRFVTFHPSLDYEDFIEGWKPGETKEEDLAEDGDAVKSSEGLALHVRKGIFRLLCEDAEKAIDEEVDKASGQNTANDDFGIDDKATVWKVSLLGTGENPVRTDCMKNGRIRIGWDDFGEDPQEAIQQQKSGAGVLKDFYHAMKPGDVVVSCYNAWSTDAVGIVESDVEWLPDVDDYQRSRRVNWIWKKGEGESAPIDQIIGARMTLRTVYRLKRFSVEKVREFLREQSRARVVVEKNIQPMDVPYVLVIDEINRGNIAKIFGELITLLEPDKRKGENCEQQVTLPFSQDPFGVPPNVYIIGTMNTADRSIGSLDYALRRRFDFYQMKPQKLDEHFNVPLFEKVSSLFLREGTMEANRDYLSEEFEPYDVMPGQSYFIAKDDAEKKLVFKYRLKPLLEEYLRDGVLLADARQVIDALDPLAE